MQIIDDSATMTAALDTLAHNNPLKAILRKRVEQLSDYGVDLGDLGRFAIIEPGEALAAVEAELSLPIAINVINGSRYGDPDFTPGWEWIVDHSGLFELVFVISDDGYGHSLFVPDHEGIDPELLSLCRHYAQREQTD